MINMEMNLLKQCKNFKRILNNVMSKNNFYVKLINNFLKQSDVKQNHYNVNDDNNISYKYLYQNINNDINLFNKLLNFWEYKFRKLYYNE